MYDKNIGMYFRHVDIIGISFSSQFEFFPEFFNKLETYFSHFTII